MSVFIAKTLPIPLGLFLMDLYTVYMSLRPGQEGLSHVPPDARFREFTERITVNPDVTAVVTVVDESNPVYPTPRSLSTPIKGGLNGMLYEIIINNGQHVSHPEAHERNPDELVRELTSRGIEPDKAERLVGTLFEHELVAPIFFWDGPFMFAGYMIREEHDQSDTYQMILTK